MSERIPQGSAVRVPLQAFLAADHVTPATGKTIAVKISRNGGAYADPNAGATNATEVGSGSYYVDLNGFDAGTAGPLFVKGTEASIDTVIAIYSVANAHNAGFDALPNTACTTNASLLTSGTGTDQVSVSAGKVLLQATQSGVTIPTVTTVTNQLTAAAIATGVWTDTTAGDFTTASSPGKILVAQLGGAFTTTSSSVYSTAALANAPTGGSAPTVSQIATAVWQDATSGDFTAVGSIGKSLFTTGAVPGAASGLALVGSAMTLTSAYDAAKTAGDATAANQTTINSNVTAVGVLTTAVKAKTDNLPANPAAVSDIPTANQNADAYLDRANAIETGLTPRGVNRLIAAALAGKLSGAGTTTITIRNAVQDSKARITAAVDSDGNRSAITWDVT